jgi:tetratricopeptide (TPR) repeat protein
MKKTRHQLASLLFSLTMWLVVLCSFGAILTKALIAKPRSVPVHYLLGSAIAASLLAVLVPSLESYVLSRVKEVSFGGVKLALMEGAMKSRGLLKYDDILPPVGDAVSFAGLAEYYSSNNYPCDDPSPGPELNSLQRYRYQKLSLVLHLLLERIEDPKDLDRESSENCRSLIENVARAAYAQKEYAKYLDIVENLKMFNDRDLDADEDFLIGHANLWAGYVLFTGSEQEDVFSRAEISLRRALKKMDIGLKKDPPEKNPNQAQAAYDLGWVYLIRDQYDKAIEWLEKSMEFRESMIPWARWNIACALKKQKKDKEALAKLNEIPTGCWWEKIAVDNDFMDAENTAFTELFKALCRVKQNRG